MTRRDFLKAVAATSGLLVIPDIRFILPDEALIVGETFLAPIRELIDFDEGGMLVVLHEVIIGKDTGGRGWEGYKQATITNVITELDFLPDARKAAAKTLSQYMRENKIPMSYLHGLPVPADYRNPFLERETESMTGRTEEELDAEEAKYLAYEGKPMPEALRRALSRT